MSKGTLPFFVFLFYIILNDSFDVKHCGPSQSVPPSTAHFSLHLKVDLAAVQAQNSRLLSSSALTLIPYPSLRSSAGSWFSSLMPLGAILGTIVGGRLVDVLGRKTSLLLMTLPFSVGWLFILIPAPMATTQVRFGRKSTYFDKI